MLTIGATLERLVLATGQAECMSAFYRDAFGYEISRVGNVHRCEASQRSIWLKAGRPNQLLEAHWQFVGADDFIRFTADLVRRGVEFVRSSDKRGDCVVLTDPTGCLLRFRCGVRPHPLDVCQRLPARLQHYAVRSAQPADLANFYIQKLGFVPSDWVYDDKGDVSAVFLRTDVEHHALAVFRAPATCFDHFSCETLDWNSLRDWADHMSKARHELAWGIGRHGPGNDTFFMVRDPDGNLAEISCDLEKCPENREAGRWCHEPRTLNLWGSAIMRS
ncbi:VOC family protein [Pelomonas sp. Root1444]|nr:VOC family protein [Pelomonas sp. Root1444]